MCGCHPGAQSHVGALHLLIGEFQVFIITAAYDVSVVSVNFFFFCLHLIPPYRISKLEWRRWTNSR